METAWALQQLRTFIELTSPDRVDTLLSAPTQAEIITAAAMAEQVVDRELPNWREEIPPSPRAARRWQQLHEACLRAGVLITRRAELEANLAALAPTLSARDFHRWAWEGARWMWSVGSYDRAVEDALARVNAETRNKVDRRDLGETKLFQLVFSTDAPKPGVPRLRLMADDGSDTFKSLHRGAAALAEGLFALLRNPTAHEVRTHEGEEQVALERLAAVSTLARTVDQAQVAYA